MKVTKMWDQAAAQELQVKAEAYLLERKPQGYKRSAGRKQTVDICAWG